jgi:hypothetical protein
MVEWSIGMDLFIVYCPRGSRSTQKYCPNTVIDVYDKFFLDPLLHRMNLKAHKLIMESLSCIVGSYKLKVVSVTILLRGCEYRNSNN